MEDPVTQKLATQFYEQMFELLIKAMGQVILMSELEGDLGDEERNEPEVSSAEIDPERKSFRM